MKVGVRQLLLVAISALLLPSQADDLVLPPTQSPSAIVKLDDARVKIGNVLVDAEKGQVSIPGKIVANIRELEVFASAPQGRTYEGLIVCGVEPIDVETGLRFLGLEGGSGVKYQGDPAVPTGDPVEIYIEWNDTKTGRAKSARAEDFVLDEKKKIPMPHVQWVHVGSRWQGKRFMAQLAGDLITLEHFPDTIIDNPLAVGAGDYSYQPNPAIVPPVGTPVTVIIQVVQQQKTHPKQSGGKPATKRPE